MIRGEIAQGSQKTKNPIKIKNKLKDLFLTASHPVRIRAIMPNQKTGGLPEAKILAILSFW